MGQSLQCHQSLRYDCLNAPLELHSYTWFRSSAGNTLDYIGQAKPGRCPCSGNVVHLHSKPIGNITSGSDLLIDGDNICADEKSCQTAAVFCNCDADEPRWLSDEGELTRPHELGVMQIYALQQDQLSAQAEGRISLGPLECVEASKWLQFPSPVKSNPVLLQKSHRFRVSSNADTQQYVVTFKSPDAYMQVPGWHRGDLSFSFRTSSQQAILLYQPLLHRKHPFFRVLLVDGSS